MMTATWRVTLARRGALLAINLLFLIVWGFAGIDKLRTGVPLWFPDKFGQTFLATFPGLTGTFWVLTLSELLAFTLCLAALVRGEFFTDKLVLLPLMLVWSLFIWVQLSLGQWLTSEFNATAQLFAYFAGTVVCLIYVENGGSPDQIG
jgi:hypothetical protein